MMWRRTVLQAAQLSALYLTIKFIPGGIGIVLVYKVTKIFVKNHMLYLKKTA